MAGQARDHANVIVSDDSGSGGLRPSENVERVRDCGDQLALRGHPEF